ncbi:MAG: CoA transferase [Dehalococcoidia bacterium]
MARALEDIRVVDISLSAAGAWTSRLLADAGADVILVEPQDGHPLRALAPFDAKGRSIPAANFLANKRAVSLDLDVPRSRRYALDIIKKADVVVSSRSPARLAEIDMTYEDLGRPSLVMAHVTAHGMTGPLAETAGNDLTSAARSGWASINGNADREPLKPAGWASSYCAGVVAYAGVVAALRWRDLHEGEGQEVDVAEAEVMAGAFAPAFLGAQYRGAAGRRRESADLMGGPVEVADGHFALTLSRAHFWRDAMNVLGLADLAEDERFGTSWYRQQHKDEYTDRVQEAMRGWQKMALFDELAVRRVVAGPVLTMAELHGLDHLRERGFWRRPDNQQDGPDYPGPAYRMTETPSTLDRRPPRAGEHTFNVLRTLNNVTDDHLLTLAESGVIGHRYPEDAR